MIIGIFLSLNSFCAIFNGSVSPAISTVTGAFMLANQNFMFERIRLPIELFVQYSTHRMHKIIFDF
jgi:hypothetical protein